MWRVIVLLLVGRLVVVFAGMLFVVIWFPLLEGVWMWV